MIGPWVEFVLVCWAGTAGLAALGWAAERWTVAERDRLAVWRVALVLAVLFALGEVTGLGRWPTAGREPPPPAGLGSGATPATAAWPLLAWGAVAGVLGAAVVARGARLRWLAGRLERPTGDALPRRVEAVARAVGYRRRVRVVVAPGLQSPLVFGAWRPVLVLPADFEAAFRPEQQDAILAHELGHLAHGDPLWQGLGHWACVALWWNPVVWLLRGRHAEVGELAADARARCLPDGATRLAEALVALGRRLATGRVAGALPATGRIRSRLGRRVQRLLADGPAPAADRPVRRWLRASAVAVAVAAVVVVAADWARPDRRAPLAAIGGAPPRSEEDIFGRLGLAPGQRREIDAALAARDAATRAMKAARTGHIERGAAINREWRAALGRTLRPDQYASYRAYWERPTTARVAGAPPDVP